MITFTAEELWDLIPRTKTDIIKTLLRRIAFEVRHGSEDEESDAASDEPDAEPQSASET